MFFVFFLLGAEVHAPEIAGVIGIFQQFNGRILRDIPQKEDTVECCAGTCASGEGFVVGGEIGGIDPMAGEFDLGDFLLCLNAPNAGSIEISGDNVRSIVTEACVVNDGRDGKREFLCRCAGVGDIPELEKAGIDVADVVSADQKGVTIGAEVKGVDGKGDGGLADLCASGGVPEVDDIVAGGEQEILGGVEGEAAHGVGVG